MRRQRLCFIATEWGTSEGGESVLNMRLVLAVARVADVSCVVLRPTSESPAGISLRAVTVDGLPVNKIAELIRSAVKVSPDWWIGHDVHTGYIANECRSGLELACILNHMDYLSYKPYEHDPESVQKSDLQSRLFQKTDLVAAVGPKLFRTVRDLAPNTRKTQHVPGCEDYYAARAPERFSLMISGRLSDKTDAVKQHRAAVLAFADCVRERALGVDPVLTVVGADRSAFEAMQRIASERAKGACNLADAGKIASDLRYAEILSRQSVVVVPSIYEGFSLVGWEALSAGVPIILSRNTGLAEFVASEHLPSLAVDLVDIRGHLLSDSAGPQPNELDVESLKSAYLRLYRECAVRKQAALDARSVLRARYQWAESASTFVNDLVSTQSDKYYSVEFGVSRNANDVAVAALSSKSSVVRALFLALKQVARSPLILAEDRDRLAKTDLGRVSNETLIRVLEAWKSVPWDFYLSYSSKGDSAACLSWLSGMTMPVKGRRVFSVAPHGLTVADLKRTIEATLKRTRPKTPIPTILEDDEEATVARAVAGLGRRLADVIRTGTPPPQWVLVMDPRLRAAVDADAKELHWRKEPVR
jgi:glycosyltransferase involved in cell wall biosynthesis